MENAIMVTVMVTFYNQKKYIYDSLNAIFSQKTNFKFEVICGDDGSTDGTYEELLVWQKKYPNICTVLQMPRDQEEKYEPIVRVSNNRYNMLKHAKGKYITFIDGDDYFTDLYKLQKQVDLLEKHPTCIACGHPVTMVWDDNPEKKQVICYISDKRVRIKKRIYWAHIWLHADTLLFRNIYKNKEESINKNFFDDNLIACYFIKYGDVIYMPESMVAYRQISDSSWNVRNNLQKMLVNMWVYSESKKVASEMPITCFIRSHFAWKWFYENRKTELVKKLDNDIIHSEKFLQDTCKYGNAGTIYRIGYDMKYFIPAHLGKIIHIYWKLKELTYREI